MKRKEEKQAELIDSLVYQRVNTIKGSDTLYNLIYKIGVVSKLEFYNSCEVALPKKKRTIKLLTEVKDVTHDYGLEFKNGITLRNISRAVFLLPFEFEHYVKVKERNPDYKPPLF